jgi:hypothetical protein
MNIKEELARLERMTTGELAQRCVKLCAEPIRTRNRAYMMRGIVWRLQALAESDLPQQPRRRAAGRRVSVRAGERCPGMAALRKSLRELA